MADRPLVSIVTPTFLREGFLQLCHACVTRVGGGSTLRIRPLRSPRVT